jgi:urease accessory protein
VVGGDHLELQVALEEGAEGLFTTPAATKLYRTAQERASITQSLTARSRGVLEWLPQETIAFSGALCDLKTIVSLEEGAQFLGWEVLCLGRPASGDTFSAGHLTQRFEVWKEETPLYVDRMDLEATSPARSAAWGLGGAGTIGTLLVAGTSESLAPLIRQTLALTPQDASHIACTDLMGVTVVRYVGPSVRDCWGHFVKIWRTVRPVLCGRPAEEPRIWAY